MAESSIIEGIFSGGASALVGPFVKWAIQELKYVLKGDHKRVIQEINVPSVAEYPTQDTAFREILNLLLPRSNNGVKCVALYGQRGVGKTTIMRNLNNHFYNKDCGHFEMVIFIRVADDDLTDLTDDRTYDRTERTERLHILQEIARRLKIKVDEQGDESQVAREIQKVLEDKIYLLILDGVRYGPTLEAIWRSLDISKHSMHSKVVMTTRYRLPLKAECVNRAVKLKRLSTDEEWEMFRRIGKLGKLSLEESDARILCKRFCSCLPILICPLASSFQGEKPLNCKTALNEYKYWPAFGDLEEIYSLLEICYKRLKDQGKEKCFLYASLYPANTKIYTRYFAECCIVQGILGDVDATTTFPYMRSKVIEKLKHLVNVALLEEGGEEMEYVRMNDLYRGFALHLSRDSTECKIYVDNEKDDESFRSESWRKATWVSMVGSGRDCLPSGKEFGNLETLLLQKNLELVQIPQNRFDSMGKLLVLNLCGTKVRELSALSILTGLKALYLNGCSDLQRDLSQIQLPKKLEVLDIRGNRVNFVPRLISLRCLRILYTSGGHCNGISELHSLEELTIDIEEIKISELLALSKLTRLKGLYLNGRSNLQIDLSRIQLPEQLEVLDIRGTGVNFVPALINLQCLRISYTPSGNYDGISELRNLKEVTIDIEHHLFRRWSNDQERIMEIVRGLENHPRPLVVLKLWYACGGSFGYQLCL